MDRRIQSLTEDLLFLLGSEGSLYQLCKPASACGKIILLGNCVGKVTRLMTRNTFAVVNSTTNRNSLISLTPECVDKLNFWKGNLRPAFAAFSSKISFLFNFLILSCNKDFSC